MTEKTLLVNSPAALAAMMRQAQSDPLFRDQLVSRGIPFGALASALAVYAAIVEQRDKLLTDWNDLFRQFGEVCAERDRMREALEWLGEVVVPDGASDHDTIGYANGGRLLYARHVRAAQAAIASSGERGK